MTSCSFYLQNTKKKLVTLSEIIIRHMANTPAVADRLFNNTVAQLLFSPPLNKDTVYPRARKICCHVLPFTLTVVQNAYVCLSPVLTYPFDFLSSLWVSQCCLTCSLTHSLSDSTSDLETGNCAKNGIMWRWAYLMLTWLLMAISFQV